MEPLLLVLIIGIILWLSIVTITLFKGRKPVATTVEVNELSLEELRKLVSELKEANQNSIQKVGFVRFNPFSETGGDQSFSVSLLNTHGTGIVITGLHTRDKTRVYAKPIVHKKSSTALAKEEIKAIEHAFKTQ